MTTRYNVMKEIRQDEGRSGQYIRCERAERHVKEEEQRKEGVNARIWKERAEVEKRVSPSSCSRMTATPPSRS